MALSQYNYSDHKLSFDIGTKTIKFRPWTTKDEKEYLMYIKDIDSDGNQIQTDKLEEQIFELLLKPCLKDPNIILTIEEKRILLIEMRKISIGDTINIQSVCTNPECSSVNQYEINFDEIVEFKPFKGGEVKVEDIVITFGDVKTENLIKRVQDAPNKIEKIFNDLLVHITAINIAGNDEKFSFEELKDFIDSLPSSMYSEISNKYSEMKSTFYLKGVSRSCVICDTETFINFSEGIPDFLWGL